MAAPNIIAATSIYGRSATTYLTTASATEVLSNTDASGVVFKVNTIIVANVDGSSAADITVAYYSEDNLGGTPTEIIQLKTIGANENLVIIDKNTALYLEENRSIGATASAGGDLKVIVSYEEIG
jgi:outer membrane protein W